MSLLWQGAHMIRTEIDKVKMQQPKKLPKGVWVPPEWHKLYANFHFRMASLGGQRTFDSYKIAREEMAVYVTMRFVFVFIKIKKFDHFIVFGQEGRSDRGSLL